jgi:hypothetical protein
MFLKLLASVSGTLVAYALYQILKLVYKELTSPLRHLPGPKSSNLLYGKHRELWQEVLLPPPSQL